MTVTVRAPPISQQPPYKGGLNYAIKMICNNATNQQFMSADLLQKYASNNREIV